MLTIVSDITMIGNHSYFNQYTQGIISDKGPWFKLIIEYSEEYNECISSIHSKLWKDFEYLQNEVNKFLVCKDIWIYS